VQELELDLHVYATTEKLQYEEGEGIVCMHVRGNLLRYDSQTTNYKTVPAALESRCLPRSAGKVRPLAS
jgi:hypothetical protein